MANYYRKNSSGRSRSGSKQEGPRWFWMLFGSLVGGVSVFLVLGFYTGLVSVSQIKSYIHDKTANTEKVKVVQAKTSSGPQIEHRVKKEAQEYEFYTLLPDMEVQSTEAVQKTKQKVKPEVKNLNSNKPQPKIASKTETPQASQAVKDRNQNQTAEKIEKDKGGNRSVAQYIIQTGIFQEIGEADSLKARLTLQGFNTHIQKVQAQDGQIFFRVTLGPFVSESQAKKEKKRLEANKIRGILILQRQ